MAPLRSDMTQTRELRTLMALAGVTYSDIAKAMTCSQQAVARAVTHPDKYPIKSMQIHLLLTEWTKGSEFVLVKKDLTAA